MEKLGDLVARFVNRRSGYVRRFLVGELNDVFAKIGLDCIYSILSREKGLIRFLPSPSTST